jgi:hypothetical protein
MTDDEILARADAIRAQRAQQRIAEADAIAARIDAIERGAPDVRYFADHELIYAAFSRCRCCGAGLAYPKRIGIMHGAWYCANVLTGRARPGADHEVLPFAFWCIKDEGQPSARGATTRPPTQDAA